MFVVARAILTCSLALAASCSRESTPSGSQTAATGGRATVSGGVGAAVSGDAGGTDTAGTTTTAGVSDGGSSGATPQGGTSTGGAGSGGGLSEGEELLYELGLNETSQVNQLLIDGPYAYWYQRTAQLYRAPKDGSGPIDVFGRWENTLSGSRIASDDTFIYWLDRTHLRRKPKSGGDTESIDLGADYGSTDFALTDDAIIVTAFGCPSVVRIDKQTLEVSPLGEPLDFEVILAGHTTLIASGTALYCANYQRLVRVDLVDGTKTLLSDALTGFRAMANLESSLYLLDFMGSGQKHRFSRLDGDVLTTLLEPAWGDWPHMASDPRTHELFWTGGTMAFAFRFAADTGEVSSFGDPRGIGKGFALDDDYIYFGNWVWVGATEGNPGGPTGSLRRIKRPR
ncbi:MAG: hypothetical protein M3020_00065 [Myxococcota bacterium]|nr:hypothetical protein [Myxococcota bacterium]